MIAADIELCQPGQLREEVYGGQIGQEVVSEVELRHRGPIDRLEKTDPAVLVQPLPQITLGQIYNFLMLVNLQMCVYMCGSVKLSKKKRNK